MTLPPCFSPVTCEEPTAGPSERRREQIEIGWCLDAELLKAEGSGQCGVARTTLEVAAFARRACRSRAARMRVGVAFRN